MKKVLKFIFWFLVGIVGIFLIGFGLYAAWNTRRIPELRGLNFAVMPGGICLVFSFLNIKQLICGYMFSFEKHGGPKSTM